MSEVATFGGGHTPPMADPDNYEDGYVLWVTSQDVKSNYLDRTTTQITEKGAKELTLYPAGSLVMVTRSGILRHTFPVAELRKPSTVNQDIRVILPQGECCGEWLLQFFISHNKELLLEFGKTGTTVESVDFGKIKDMLLHMPSTVEQQQIGNYFAKLDRLISLHQRKRRKESFSRYPVWELRKFSDMYVINNERNANCELGYDRTLSIATMTFNGGNGAADDSLSNYKVIRVGDIAFEGHTNKAHAYGRFVLNDAGDGLMSPRFSCLRPIVEQRYSFWKYYIPREESMRPILVNATKSGTMMNELVPDDLMHESILVPCLAEQEVIGNSLSQLDHLITLHQ